MASQARTGFRFRAFPSKNINPTSTLTKELNDAVKLISHQIPGLPAGNYTAKFDQYVVAPDAKSETLSSKQSFAVRVPQLRLDPNVDVNLVFPAPGHSDHGNTLPHIVFNDPSLPWERSMKSVAPTSFNKVPWIALPTFTEEELKVPATDLEKWKLGTQDSRGICSIAVRDLKALQGPALLSPVQKIDLNAKDLYK